MKKITFLLTLFLLSLGVEVSLAQDSESSATTLAVTGKVFSAADIVDGGTYVLYNKGRGKYINEETVGGVLKMRSFNFGESEAGLKSVITINGNTTDGFTFQVRSGAYIPQVPDGSCTAGTTAAKFNIELHANDGGNGIFKIGNRDAETGLGFDGQNENFVGWNYGSGSNSQYEIYAVKEITYSADAADFIKSTSNFLANAGVSIGAYSRASINELTSKVKDYCDTPTSEKQQSITTYISSMKIVSFADIAEGTVFQIKDISGQNQGYLAYDEDYPDKVELAGNGADGYKTLADEKIHSEWSVVRHGNDSYIFNIATGRFMAVGSGVKLADTGAAVTVEQYPDNPIGFTIKLAGDNRYLDMSKGHGAGNDNSVGFYGTAKAAAFIFTETEIDAGILQKVKDIASATEFYTQAEAYFNSVSAEYVGGYSETEIADLRKAYDDCKATTNAENIDKLKAALQGMQTKGIKLSTDKYYRIIFKRGNAAMTNMYATISGGTAEAVAASCQVAWADADGEMAADNSSDNQRAVVVNPDYAENDMSAIWQFENISGEEGKYYIKNVNTGLYLGQAQNGNKTDAGHLHILAKGADLQYAGNYSIYTSNTNHTEKALYDNKITANEKYLNTYYNPTPNNGRGIGLWSGATNDGGNVVYLKEVTEIPVSISAAGYSTLNLPFAVTIPTTTENPIKAYTVTSVNDDKELVMEELTGVIPANTAVILQAGEGTYNFTIAPAAAPVEGNLLTGTTLERHGMEAGSYYGLANKTQGVAFYVANSTEVPANKAILKKDDVKNSSVQGANALTFFGETTGIGGVQTKTTADDDNTYYDLNGRRVMYPSHGIYVKGNGQKVFIK